MCVCSLIRREKKLYIDTEKHISRKDTYEFPLLKEEEKLQVEKAQSTKAQRMRNQNLENLR